MITAIPAWCVDILWVCGMILGGGVPDGVRPGVGVAGMVLGVVGAGGVRAGVLSGAGIQPMWGRDGIIRRDGAGLTMRAPAGGWHLLALTPPLLPATTTTGRVLTLLPAEARLTRHLGVQQLHPGVHLLAVLLRKLRQALYTLLIHLLRIVPLVLLDLPFRVGTRAREVSVLFLLLAVADLGKPRHLCAVGAACSPFEG
jgi:hypothetical protein